VIVPKQAHSCRSLEPGNNSSVVRHFHSRQLQLDLLLEGLTRHVTISICLVFDEDNELSSAMSSAAEADPISLKVSEQKGLLHHSDIMDSNHDDDLPAQSVNEADNHNTTEKDDAATMAASEELKHTRISDSVHVAATLKPTATRLGLHVEDKDMKETVKESTPEPEPTAAQDEEMKEKLSSPKKKRGRDTYDESKELESDNVDKTGPSADGSAVNGSRLEREGPEKKRHRDTSEDPLKVADKAVEVKVCRIPVKTPYTC
jgi:hypothetical protein